MNTEELKSPSHSAAVAFVHCVLVVDDNLSAGGDTGRPSPKAGLRRPKDINNEAGVDASPERDQSAVPKLHTKIEVERLSASFVQREIVCGVLGLSSSELIASAAHRADALVIDWNLDNDGGERTREALSRLGKSIGLRLAIVYTDEDPELVRTSLETIATGSSDGHVRIGDLHIAVVGKRDVSDARDGYATLEELPDLVIRQFAEVANGLVRAAALRALASLRSSAHLILDAFPPELDLGYVGHRAAVSDKASATAQVVSLLAEEIRSVVENDRSTAQAVDREAVEHWLTNTLDPSSGRVPLTSRSQWVESDHASKEARDALGTADSRSPKSDERKRAKFTQQLATDADAAFVADAVWSAAVALKRVWPDARRDVTLGTVLKSGREWWISLQPVCEAVRLHGPTPFLLLPAREVEAHSGYGRAPYDMVIRDGAEFVRLRWRGFKSRDVRLAVFAPDSATQAVTADREGHVAELPTYRIYRWVAQLHANQSQRLAAEFAVQLGRVGLDESEWQRAYST